MAKTTHGGWPKPARRIGEVWLRFTNAEKKVLTNVSAGTRADGTLFIAADEHASINRLVAAEDGPWIEEGSVALRDLLPLADPDAEADLEGLAADDGWLWVVGSHARTRA
jgi:hypothetical protein